MEKRKTASAKIATAIEYSPGDPAPALLASGRGLEAERIIAVAQQAGVAVVEDEALAVLLDSWVYGQKKPVGASPKVRPGEFIPMWCWEAAAKILALVIDEGKKRFN